MPGALYCELVHTGSLYCELVPTTIRGLPCGDRSIRNEICLTALDRRSELRVSSDAVIRLIRTSVVMGNLAVWWLWW
jgi:hypothetical protein